MRYVDYLNGLSEKYPDKNVKLMVENGQCNKVELIKSAAEWCFVDSDNIPDIAKETRKQLISLQNDGVTCFDA